MQVNVSCVVRTYYSCYRCTSVIPSTYKRVTTVFIRRVQSLKTWRVLSIRPKYLAKTTPIISNRCDWALQVKTRNADFGGFLTFFSGETSPLGTKKTFSLPKMGTSCTAVKFLDYHAKNHSRANRTFLLIPNPCRLKCTTLYLNISTVCMLILNPN